jgi:Rhodanese-like domain
MDKEGRQQSPIPACCQVVEAEKEVLLDKLWVLLPSPEACRYASDDKNGVYFQAAIRPCFTSAKSLGKLSRDPSPLLLTRVSLPVSFGPDLFHGLRRRFMRSLIAALVIAFIFISVWVASSFAQQPRRYPVDPQTKWAIGAKPTPADELKKQLDSGTAMIIDVRQPASFEKETIPGAINVPLDELESYLKKISKDTYIVFT